MELHCFYTLLSVHACITNDTCCKSIFHFHLIDLYVTFQPFFLHSMVKLGFYMYFLSVSCEQHYLHWDMHCVYWLSVCVLCTVAVFCGLPWSFRTFCTRFFARHYICSLHSLVRPHWSRLNIHCCSNFTISRTGFTTPPTTPVNTFSSYETDRQTMARQLRDPYRTASIDAGSSLAAHRLHRVHCCSDSGSRSFPLGSTIFRQHTMLGPGALGSLTGHDG